MVIGLLMAIPFTSCQDNFLDQKNPNALSTDSFWKTVGDLDLGLTSVYNTFKNQNIYQIVPELNRSDLSWPGWGRPNSKDVYFLQTFNESSSAPNNKWAALYTGIFRANQVIEAYDKLKGTFDTPESEELAAGIYAQARFFRGMFHFYLHNSFNNGSVIIFDFVPKSEADFYQTISDADAVEAFYRKDLEYAYENLPAKWTATKDIGRVTSGAAAAMLGKSYLYAGDYDTAATYFKDVIENADYGYQLVSNIGDNFTSKNEFNSESILEIGYTTQFKSEVSVWDEEQTSNSLNYSFSPVGGWRSAYPACWLIMQYKKEKPDANDPSNYVTAIGLDGEPLQNQNGEDSVRLRIYSKRTSQSIALVDDMDTPYYLETYTARGTNFNNGETAYWRKYTNWDIVTNERDFEPAQRSPINVRLIRLADVYLMYAECLIKGGTDDAGVDEAMKYINRVRRRSSVVLLGQNGTGEYPAQEHDGITYAASSLMDELMYVERPLELSAEGNAIRTIDLRRWGITKQRFEDLAVGLYNNDSFKFIDANGKSGTRWGSVLKEVATVDEAHKRYVNRSMPANNYVESEHAYWPLPNGEITANPSLYSENN